MAQYKLLVADIDGTVVDHGSDGSEVDAQHPSRQAVTAAQKAGKHVTFATGRNFEWAEPIIKAFNITSPVITNNGSWIVDPVSRLPLWERRLDLETARRIYDFILERGLAGDSKLGLGHLEEKPFADITEEDFADLIYLDLIGFSDKSTIEQITTLVGQYDHAAAVVVPSPQFHGRKNIIVTNAEGTKYQAMLQLQELLKVPASETIAIGDAKNDLPLFRASGFKIAVDNADDTLKAAADTVVSSVHEHGLVDAINDYLLAGWEAPTSS